MKSLSASPVVITTFVSAQKNADSNVIYMEKDRGQKIAYSMVRGSAL